MTTEETIQLQDPVYLGYVKKVHGIKGKVVARIFNVLMQSEIPVDTELVFGEDRAENVQESSVRDSETIFLSLSSIGSAEEAEKLKGKSIRMARKSTFGLPEFLPVYLFVGMTLSSNDRELQVVDVFPDSVNPLLLMGGVDGVFPIPLTMVFDMGKIDWEENSIHLVIPNGMEKNTGDWN
ncbi:MAG: hypothetical protein H8D05_01535 [FCB group bacterium]|nr:hypothetical protein [FCB group bacterium]